MDYSQSQLGGVSVPNFDLSQETGTITGGLLTMFPEDQVEIDFFKHVKLADMDAKNQSCAQTPDPKNNRLLRKSIRKRDSRYFKTEYAKRKFLAPKL
jgi:hypothetical protein